MTRTTRQPEHARELTPELIAERRELCGDIIIHGHRKTIVGSRLPFALVLHEEGGRDEVSWETVKRWRNR